MLNKLGNNERLISLAVIMVMVVACILTIVMTILYKSSLNTQKTNLTEMVEMQSQLMRSVARFDAKHSKKHADHIESATETTFSQIFNALEHSSGFEKTGEIVIGIIANNKITFNRSPGRGRALPSPVPVNSKMAAPMQLALAGKSGIITALDYKGSVVLAAYAPLPELSAGLVIKIDRAEIIEPFITAGLIALLSSLPVIILGIILFQRVGQPFVRNLEKNVQALEKTKQALKKSLIDTEIASKYKTDFLANMSHELRTPLNAILGFSSLIHDQLLGPIDNPKYIEYAKDISNSGEHLLSIICDILDLSKIEAGEHEINLQDTPLPPLLNFCLTTAKNQAKGKNITLLTNIDNLDITLNVDQLLLKRIIINLLSNAVKFTQKSGTVELIATISQDGNLHINVVDNGIGISKKDMARIFKPFAQVSSSQTKSQAGTGLGLPISISLAASIGAELTIESSLGKGTTCSLIFPKNFITPP